MMTHVRLRVNLCRTHFDNILPSNVCKKDVTVDWLHKKDAMNLVNVKDSSKFSLTLYKSYLSVY